MILMKIYKRSGAIYRIRLPELNSLVKKPGLKNKGIILLNIFESNVKKSPKKSSRNCFSVIFFDVFSCPQLGQ